MTLKVVAKTQREIAYIYICFFLQSTVCINGITVALFLVSAIEGLLRQVTKVQSSVWDTFKNSTLVVCDLEVNMKHIRFSYFPLLFLFMMQFYESSELRCSSRKTIRHKSKVRDGTQSLVNFKGVSASD